MNDAFGFLKIFLVCASIFAAFAFAGRGDYEQQVELENAQLKADIALIKHEMALERHQNSAAHLAQVQP